jgi:pimeloyl-ACP methyl ester carboxylesterase
VSATAQRKAGAVGPSSRLVLLLEKFRAAHSPRTLNLDGDRWEYITAGGTETTLVILPGAGGSAEIMFEIVSALEPRFRVVSIGYPSSVSTAEKLILGVRAILDANGVEQVFFIGHSLGGLLAQGLTIRHPERVRGMVLADTGFYRGPRAWIMTRAPAYLVTRLAKAQMNRSTRNAEAHEFWLEYFSETLSEPEQAMRQRHQAACLTDLLLFLRQHPIDPNLDWVRSMPVLAITPEGDRSEQKHLRALYPTSTVHEFPRDAGHASFIVRPQEFSDAIASFVENVVVKYNGDA